MPNPRDNLSNLSREEVAANTEHLGRNCGREAINLSSVLLDLSADEQRIQARWLLGKLEQLLPLVLREQWLLLLSSESILLLSLLLPSGDLGLFSTERALVILSVVLFYLVALNAVEQQVASLLQEGINGKIKVVKVWREWVGGDVGIVSEIGQGSREVQGCLLW